MGVTLVPLVAAGLVDLRPLGSDEAGDECWVYALHPGVAEAGRAAAGVPFQAAVDTELAAFWKDAFVQGCQEEKLSSGGLLVLRASHGAVPYLMRQQRWEEAATQLERPSFATTYPRQRRRRCCRYSTASQKRPGGRSMS